LRERDLQAARQVEMVLGRHDVGDAALAGLRVDPDDRLVRAADVLRVDRQVRHLPRVLVDREIPLVQQFAHDAADLAGGTHDSDAHQRPLPAYTMAGSSPPRSNASCTASTAASTSVSLISTEIRISEVLIISMLIPALAIASQTVAGTPGCERMPPPTSDTLPTWSSYSTASKPTSSLMRSSAATADGPLSLDKVKVMSVTPEEVRETFCSTMSMSMLASATARKMRAAAPL